MKQSYAHDIFLAEEIGLSVARNIKIPSSSDVIVKTEETRPTTASIINHNLHEANKWYEIKLSRNLRNWQIRCRSNQNICYSYSPTHQNYFTLSSGDVLSSDTSPNADLNAIYVMCETAGVIVEVEVWEK